jgi:SAM-dependent methyltransferase
MSVHYPTYRFQEVFQDPSQREEFSKFLNNIFLQFDEKRFYTLIDDIMSHAETDEDIYKELAARVGEAKPENFFEWLAHVWKGLSQLAGQMTSQARELIGGGQKVDGFMEIGDGYAGRYVRPMQKVVQMSGTKVVVNRREELADYLLCGFPRPRDMFLPLNDYDPISTQIKDRSIGLATCWIGLHHAPEEKLVDFIKSIHRVLRPGGIFLLRDHDASTERMKTFVNVVHSVFNAGLPPGRVSLEDELNHVRNFRGLDEWTSLLEYCGFERVDGGPCIVKGDPTDNGMIMFRKIATTEEEIAIEEENERLAQEAPKEPKDFLEELFLSISAALRRFTSPTPPPEPQEPKQEKYIRGRLL